MNAIQKAKKDHEQFSDKMNRLQHGEVLQFKVIQSIVGEFLALARHGAFLDSLIPSLEREFKGDPNFKMLPYYKMVVMFIQEFKKQADSDPVIKEMMDAGERAAFLAGMGGGL